MSNNSASQYKQKPVAMLKNPHFWAVVTISVILILIYQAWPWREWQFTEGVWRFFPWLSSLYFIVVDLECRYHVIGILFFIPIIYGSLSLSWQGGLIAWLLSLIWVLPTLINWQHSLLITNIALLLLPALLVAIVTLERQWRNNEKGIFAERERERQLYISKLVETQENERHRIAQEIHDENIQTLMVIANRADSLASSCTSAEGKQGNIWIKEAVLHTMEDLRRLSLNLRPSILDNFGLVSGLRWLVNNSNSQKNIHIDISIKGEERKISPLTEVTLFRVTQEAIQNIKRHSQAKKASVVLEFDDLLKLTLRDDGIGFKLPNRLTLYANEGKLGLIGMEQRILSVGGTVKIDSKPGEGTVISIEVPCAPTAGINDIDR
jgi:two-component system sensor histidine kinase DegS